MSEQEEPITVDMPDQSIPLDELHYDPSTGLHKRADCGVVPCSPDSTEPAPDGLEDLTGAELLEDMLAHLREMARSVRQRHYEAITRRGFSYTQHGETVTQVRATRALAAVLLPMATAADEIEDHRRRLVAYRRDVESETSR